MIAALATDVTVRGVIIQQAWLNGGGEACLRLGRLGNSCLMRALGLRGAD